jgi:hypothetical protein
VLVNRPLHNELLLKHVAIDESAQLWEDGEKSAHEIRKRDTSSSDETEASADMADDQAPPPSIYYLHATTRVFSRFANTLIVSRVANRRNQSAQVEFAINLPESAMISNFSMFVLWFLNITMSICSNISGKLTTKSYTEK